MIVKTQSGTVYEFRLRAVDVTTMADEKQQLVNSGWEGHRYNSERALHKPVDDWTPVRLAVVPEIGLRFLMQFEGYEEWLSTAVLWLEITDTEREAFNA